MKFDRISSYQFEDYFSELARIFKLKLARYIVNPKAVTMDTNNTIFIIQPLLTSLY